MGVNGTRGPTGPDGPQASESDFFFCYRFFQGSHIASCCFRVLKVSEERQVDLGIVGALVLQERR